MEQRPVTITITELVGMLSLAADLGLGQPMEHLARSCLIATRFGGRIGLTGADLPTTYSYEAAGGRYLVQFPAGQSSSRM